MGPPLKSNEIEERLLKYEESKGKDKGRVKFNFFTNEQLRNLKYKSKSLVSNSPSKKEEKEKVHYDEDEEV